MANSKAVFRTLPWKQCVSFCTAANLDNFTNWRGYSKGFVDWLVAQNLLGFYPVSPNVYYPCLPVFDARGNFLGEHVFTGRRTGMKAVYTDGAKPMPFVMGSPKLGAEWEFFEGQWDAFSVADATGWYLDTAIVFAASRGATNTKACRGLVPNGARVYLWPQNDDLTLRVEGKTPAEAWTLALGSLYPDAWIAPLTESVHDHNDAIRHGFKNFQVCRDMAVPLSAMLNLGYQQSDALEITEALKLKKTMPTEIIKGVLHQGGKLLIAGGSKTYKSFGLMDLAVCVSNGLDFWDLPTTKGRVLFLNLELLEPVFWQRLEQIAKRRNASLSDIDVINLRGKRISQKLFRRLEAQIKGTGYALIILDPSYKLLAGRSESDSGDITEFLNRCEDLAQAIGAAIALSHHFAKGNQAGREAIDRTSGSGVWARDPDAFFPLTPHEEPGCFVVEPVVRDFAPLKPFVLRFNFPVFERATALDPGDLKRRSDGRFTAKYSIDQLLNQITLLEPLTTAEFKRRVMAETGMSKTQFHRLLSEIKAKGLLVQEPPPSLLWKLPTKKP